MLSPTLLYSSMSFVRSCTSVKLTYPWTARIGAAGHHRALAATRHGTCWVATFAVVILLNVPQMIFLPFLSS